MYVNSPNARLFMGLAKLGSLVVRGVSAASKARRTRQVQAQALDNVALGLPPPDDEGEEPGCGECEETRQQLEDEAAAIWGER